MHIKIFLAFSVIVILCSHVVIGNASPSDATILVVNDIDNAIQTYAWYPNMSLFGVARLSDRSPYTKIVYVFSETKMQRFKSLNESKARATIIAPNDIIIFGTMSAAREAKLRKNADIDRIFKLLPPMQYFEY